MIKQFITPFELGSNVTFKLGNSTIKGRVDKVMKPGYIFKDTDTTVMRYLIHIDDTSYIVVPHSLLT